MEDRRRELVSLRRTSLALRRTHSSQFILCFVSGVRSSGFYFAGNRAALNGARELCRIVLFMIRKLEGHSVKDASALAE